MARRYPSWGTRIEATDIALLAKAMGCEGVNVDSARALEAVLAGSYPTDRPLVIGAAIDPTQYAAQF
jgi:thiamine pyrophosphate-dependent acetolactate synthase large subunit-like protein